MSIGPDRDPAPDIAELFEGPYASYAFRQHLDSRHHLPAGLSYLVPREGLPGFHAEAHAAPGRLRGWLRVRRLRRARRAG